MTFLFMLVCFSAYSQNIDISAGMSKVESELGSIYDSGLQIASILFGIAALIGLIIAGWNMYVSKHEDGWHTGITWFAILGFIAIALYVVKEMF